MMNGWQRFLADLAFLEALADEERLSPIELYEFMREESPFRTRELRPKREELPFYKWPEKRAGSPFPEEVRQPGGPEFFPHPDVIGLVSAFLQARVPPMDIRAVPGGVIVSARSARKAKLAFTKMAAPLFGMWM